MKVRAFASTKMGYQITNQEALMITGYAANVCYMKEDFDTILAEPLEKTLARAKGTIASGHHSVAEHARLTFVLEGIPKILAMTLNNMGTYSISEKSARYTKMKASPEETAIYEKWIGKISELADLLYHDKYYAYYRAKIMSNSLRKGESLSEEEIQEKTMQTIKAAFTKIGQENARLAISIFTPATTAVRSIDLRQLNYELYWMQRFIEREEDTDFNVKLKAVYAEYIKLMEPYKIEKLDTGSRIADITLFDKRKDRKEEWGENYSVNYKATWASLAQAHRHRTLRYTTRFLDTFEFCIPEIIKGNKEYEEEWVKDIMSLAHLYPQGSFIMVNERGTYEDFMKKCEERLCGCAQLETAIQTKKTMDRYLEETKDTNPSVYEELLKYGKGARCTFPCWKCVNPCVWGAKDAFNRLI